jgi:peptide/nickel transport system substrate-binding protein
MAVLSDPKSFNPIMAKESTTTLSTSMMFEGLTTQNAETLEVEPLLARRWSVSDDGLTWTFYLRKDISWNDGHPFTADDVIFTFEKLIYNDAIPSSARDILTIDGQIFKLRKVNDYTVQFTLPVRFSPFLRAMSQSILPKHRLEKIVEDGKFAFAWGIDALPEEIVGTGPFRLKSYYPGERVILERNPHYWKRSEAGHALPYLDGVIMLVVQNENAIILKFIEGDVDYCSVRGSDYPILKPLEADRNFTLYEEGPDFGSNFLVFNQNLGVNEKQAGKPYVEERKLNWFTDLEFRRAVAHAIDREQMIKIVKNGLGHPQHSPMSPSAGFFYNDRVVKYEYDPVKAAQILRDAGYFDRNGDGFIQDKEGNTVEFNLNTNAGNVDREQIAAMIRRDLSQLGMKVNFLTMEFNALIQQLNASFDWDAVLLGLTGGIEPHFGKNVWHSSGQLHLWFPRQENRPRNGKRASIRSFLKGFRSLTR